METPDGASLSRKELQQYLKSWGLRATGTTAALRISFEQAKQARSETAVAAASPPKSVAIIQPPSSEKKKRAAPQKEKRLKRFRSSCPSKVWDRIERALTQRLYLVKRGEVVSSCDDLQCDFVVLGSTGNIYNVSIGKLPTCNCPDHARGNHPCKHILFVLLKVIGLPSDSPYIYQFALTTNELVDMFDTMGARRVGGSAIMANASVQSTYAKLATGDVSCKNEEDDGVAVRKSLEHDSDCPICFDPMKKDGALTFCRAMCGTNFHADCIRRWCQHNQNCPNCRQPWQNDKKGKTVDSEGYTNLGSLQGQSPHRDTSTYRHSPWYDRNRRRYW